MSNLNNTLIKANGKEYFVNYNMSAFMMLERNHGITIDKIMQDIEGMENSKEIKLDSLFYILKCGLDRAYNTNHDDEEVFNFMDDLIDEYGMEEAMVKIMKIVEKSLVSEKQKRQQEHFIKAGNNKPYKGANNKQKKS